ncbi:hypothetical protein BCIN_08g04550 [Botrytis cinerea B05.10]|uniref:Uncharacterized protein n=1 Tax=Botryotinia fuckeliana (strain B05.10) TaxID=332648 RepID=A0A384JR11_BOTFB|nr:hypothetical protein BCIN_08g04550 [Botrytis cinerea B05.10]ATZ52827.1 hypothetical protein BCIN_08g04550 [Botrytis cinerea B05.10]
MEGSEWQHEPLPDFLRSPGLQDFIKEVYKGKKAKPTPQFNGLHNLELDLGDAAYDYAVLDGPVKQTWGDLSQWFNAAHGYDGTLPKVAPPKESDELDIQPKYNALFWYNNSIDSVSNRIARQAQENDLDSPDIDYYHQPKPFLRGLINFENLFGNTRTPFPEYSNRDLRQDLIAASLFHHIATTILKNPFFFLDDTKTLNETVNGPQNPVDQLYYDLLRYKSFQNELVARSFRANIIRLLRPREEYSHSRGIADTTNGKIRRVAQARARQWLSSEAQNLWLPTADKIDEHEIEILYERAAELTVEVAAMTGTDILTETLEDYTPFPHPTIPCLPLSFWKHYKAGPSWHNISEVSKNAFGDISVPPPDLKDLNELEKQVKLVRCRLVIYVYIEDPENIKATPTPFVEVEWYPYPHPFDVGLCPEQIYLELPQLEKQEPDLGDLEIVLARRGLFGEKIVWRKGLIFYKWLAKSAAYYIPFYSMALGAPLVLAYVFSKLLSLGSDEEVGWWLLPDIWNLLYSWRDALSSYFFRIAGWLGILKCYDLAMTALYSLFGSWFGTFAYGWELILHSVTTSREYMSGLYDSTAEYVVSTRIWNIQLFERELVISFLSFFTLAAILYYLADRAFARGPAPAPRYSSPLFIAFVLIQLLWLGPVRLAVMQIVDYVSDVPKTVTDILGGLLHLPETFNWGLEWISEIGGNTTVSITPELDPSHTGISIIPEPEPGAYDDDVPQPFRLSPDVEKMLSESTIGDTLTGSKLGEAILVSNLSKEKGSLGIAEMLERSELGQQLEDLGFGQSLVGGEPIDQALKGSLLGYILTGSDTEKRLVTARLGATLAKSDLAHKFVGSEFAKTLPQSALADLITEALNLKMGLKILNSGPMGQAEELSSIPMLGEVLSGLNLAETLEGSLLGSILTGSTSEPILPTEALTAWEDLAPPEPYVPGTLAIEAEPAPPVVAKIGTVAMKLIMTLLTPFQLAITRIASALMKAPIIESLLPMVTTVVNTALKPLAPVIGFLGSFSSTTEQSSDQKPGYIPENGAPIAEYVLPIIAKGLTVILKPFVSLVAMFSGSSSTGSPNPSLEISFDPAKVSFVVTFILIPVFATGCYISMRLYFDAWNQAKIDVPLPPQGIPPPAGDPAADAQAQNLPPPPKRVRDMFTFVFHKIRLAFVFLYHFLGASYRLFKYVFRPFAFLCYPFIWLFVGIIYVFGPFRRMGYPFVYIYGQITRLGRYIWELLVDQLPSARTLFFQTLALIIFTLHHIQPLFEYAYWLFIKFEDYRHPRPPLPQLPFVNQTLDAIVRLYEMIIQLFADIRQRLSDLYNHLNLNNFAPIRGIIDAIIFLCRQILHIWNFFVRALRLFNVTLGYFLYVMLGWDTRQFFAPEQGPEILWALRAIRSALWRSPLAPVKVPANEYKLRRHHLPGFARGRHRSLPHPQWFPYFHLMIGTFIGTFIYLTAGGHPSGHDFISRTSDLNSTLDEMLKI